MPSPPLARTRCTAALLLVAALALLAPAAAQAAWGGRHFLVPAQQCCGGQYAGESAGPPDVGIDANGNAVAAWGFTAGPDGAGTEARVRTSAGSWSPLRKIDFHGSDGGATIVESDAQSNAEGIWSGDGNSVRRRLRSPSLFPGTDQNWKPYADFVSPSATNGTPHPNNVSPEPDLAINPAGAAVTAYMFDDGSGPKLYARLRPNSSTFWQPHTGALNLPGTNTFTGRPQVAIDPNGNAALVWRQQTAAGQRIYFRAHPVGASAWGPPEQVSQGSAENSPDVAIDAGGGVAVVWTHAGNAEGANVIQSNTRPASPSFTGAKFVASKTATISKPDAAGPFVVLDSAGRGVAAWEGNNGGADPNYRAQLRPGTVSGGFANSATPAQTYSPAGVDASLGDLAIIPASAAGDGVVIWATQNGDASEIQARGFTTNPFAVQARATLESGPVSHPRVAVYPTRKAVAVWLNDAENAGDACGPGLSTPCLPIPEAASADPVP